mmetsp:Transcript_1544/g.2830  ORF Transcript_1544/g.2830 Transcript_1544/m.2830 type:complete len:447 (-) Transcript_1544:54-1394(-)
MSPDPVRHRRPSLPVQIAPGHPATQPWVRTGSGSWRQADAFELPEAVFQEQDQLQETPPFPVLQDSPAKEVLSKRAPSLASTAQSSCSSSAGSMTPSLSPASLPCDASFPEPLGEWWSLDMVDEGTPRRIALEDLRHYIQEFQARPQDDFWHRKSKKPVLSVVVCCRKDGQLECFRGMNTEVSLPAGSLCAERAAIARAASDFHQASDILAIATADPSEQIVPLWPCEVCQSWLAKLRPQSPFISVIAVASNACDRFAVKVNGELQRPPLLPVPASLSSEGIKWKDRVILAEGAVEWPWEAHDLVYVDGAWTFFHAAQQNILRQARSRGSHLLVGVHPDEVLQGQFTGPVLENYTIRAGRILQNRHVCSVLADAPWAPTIELISSLGIKRVVMGTVCKVQDIGLEFSGDGNPYRAARDLGILEVLTSSDDTTERLVHSQLVSQARM